MENEVILVKDLLAEKSQSSFGRFRSSSKSVRVLKGELLIAIPGDKLVPRKDGTKPHNYRLTRDTTVSLRAEPDEIAPLNRREFAMLEAVKSCHTCYSIFLSSEKLDWGLSLRKGSEVYVLVNPEKHQSAWMYSKAVVCWFGDLGDQRGIFFGVEIVEEGYHGQGVTDGTYQGKRYFTCQDGCGFFVALDKLSPHPDGSDLPAVPVTRSKSKKEAPNPPAKGPRFKAKDRIVVYSNKGTAVCGTVRWVGKHSSKSVYICGLEMDVAVQKSEFPDAIPDMSHLIKATIHKNKLFLTEPFVMSEAEVAEIRQQQKIFFESFIRFEAEAAEAKKQEKLASASTGTSVDPENTEAVAEQLGTTAIELIDEELEALKQAKKEKEGLQKDLDFDEQVEAMRQFEKENKEKMRAKVQQNQEEILRANMPTARPRGGRPSSAEMQQNLQYDRHAAAELQRYQDPRMLSQYGQPVPQHLNGSGQPGHFQRSASSPHQSPQLEAQHEHGRQPHQQPQSTQLTPGSHLQPSDSNIPSPVALSPYPALALGIGSMVQISSCYGVVRWIGYLAEVQGTIAGVELEEGMNGCTDGSRNGVQYFTCKPGRGFFCPISSLRLDEREISSVRNPLWKWPLEESTDRYNEDIDASKYLGEERGIQGHQNSCYLDATVFGLFAVSDVFDSIFLKTAPDADVSEILQKRIVNPLRKHGVVRYESVMALRNKLEEIGKMKGVNQDEKDPEKFLNMLFKHALHVEPFITIKRPFGVEQEYFFPLFLKFDKRVKIPLLGFLLTKMSKEQNISFTEAPSKLLIQVPRFGKKFKTYDKIVPDLRLDIGELLPSHYKCLVCSEPARNKCNSCLVNGSANSVYFCDVCCNRAHSEATNRGNHQVETATTNAFSMQLLSVICIETNHYVCFTHSGGRWIFMDSMANKVYDTYNIPKGVDCTQDLDEWVYTEDQTRLLSTPPRELPEYVRRFTQDIYMCVYINPDLAMYREGLGIAEPAASQLHEFSQLESHWKEQDLQMKLQDLQTQLLQSQQKEQDLQRQLAQSRQTEQDLERHLQLTTKAMQDLQLQSHSQASSRKLEFWNVPRTDIQVVSEIGRGGWGTVLKGTFQGRAVAVKQLHPDILSKENIQRLHREVHMMAQVRHPNLLLFIAAVFDDEVERLRSPPLIVMELLDTDLRKAYKTKLILSHDRIPIFRDVAFALNYLHNCREPIIHRDLSAPNVLLEALANNRWKAKVSDFGSANLAKVAQTTAEGAIIYSAPETLPDELRGPNPPKIPQTPKIDVYSYGVLLCEVITRKLPDKFKQLKAEVQQSWPLMHSLISSCTNYYPDDRPTIAQVLKQLQKLP